MNQLTTAQTIIALISIFGIGYLTCYTIMYEDMKDKYEALLKSQKEQNQVAQEYNYLRKVS